MRYEVRIAFRRRGLEVAIEYHFRDSSLVLTRVRKLPNNRPVSSLVRPYTFHPHSLFDSQLYSGPTACTSGAHTELIRFYYGAISVISVRLPRGDARAAPTWPVSDFILIRSVIIGEPAEEKTAPAGPVGRGAMNEAPEVSRADPRASQTI